MPAVDTARPSAAAPARKASPAQGLWARKLRAIVAGTKRKADSTARLRATEASLARRIERSS